MAKRVATRELTDRNWDDEEEPEEAGQFIQATDDVIKNRQIKKAKRRGPPGSEGGASVFAGFGGLKSTTTKPSFSLAPKTNGSDSNSGDAASGKTGSKSESEFLVNLKSLNESVATWIKQHVDKNPFCILTPIFKDYEKHLADLEKDKKIVDKENSSKDGDTAKERSDSKTSSDAASGGFKFSTNGTTSVKSGFTFGLSTSSTTPTTSSFGSTTTSGNGGFGGFSFGSGSGSITSGFSFGSATGSLSSSAKTDENAGGEDEDYVPPVAEVEEVKEEGSFYTKRCKLFYQKDGKWIEKGVGNLHLKKADDKLQLVIRADTNLGNIMLNIMVPEGIPVKKQGKNNVFFVCVPNPPFDPKAESDKPVPILLRVKTSEDAEELVTKIDEGRK